MYKMQSYCSQRAPCSTRDPIPSQWTESKNTLHVLTTRENRMEIFRNLSAKLLALFNTRSKIRLTWCIYIHCFYQDVQWNDIDYMDEHLDLTTGSKFGDLDFTTGSKFGDLDLTTGSKFGDQANIVYLYSLFLPGCTVEWHRLHGWAPGLHHRV